MQINNTPIVRARYFKESRDNNERTNSRPLLILIFTYTYTTGTNVKNPRELLHMQRDWFAARTTRHGSRGGTRMKGR